MNRNSNEKKKKKKSERLRVGKRIEQRKKESSWLLFYVAKEFLTSALENNIFYCLIHQTAQISVCLIECALSLIKIKENTNICKIASFPVIFSILLSHISCIYLSYFNETVAHKQKKISAKNVLISSTETSITNPKYIWNTNEREENSTHWLEFLDCNLHFILFLFSRFDFRWKFGFKIIDINVSVRQRRKQWLSKTNTIRYELSVATPRFNWIFFSCIPLSTEFVSILHWRWIAFWCEKCMPIVRSPILNHLFICLCGFLHSQPARREESQYQCW